MHGTGSESSDSGLPTWHVDVDGCVNFRDAGGWPTSSGGAVRRGRLFRSDDPIRITPAGREAVGRLDLALVVDLRQQSQFQRAPGFVEPARTAHMPLVDQVVDPQDPPPLDTPSDIADLYVGMLDGKPRPARSSTRSRRRHPAAAGRCWSTVHSGRIEPVSSPH